MFLLIIGIALVLTLYLLELGEKFLFCDNPFLDKQLSEGVHLN